MPAKEDHTRSKVQKLSIAVLTQSVHLLTGKTKLDKTALDFTTRQSWLVCECHSVKDLVRVDRVGSANAANIEEQVSTQTEDGMMEQAHLSTTGVGVRTKAIVPPPRTAEVTLKFEHLRLLYPKTTNVTPALGKQWLCGVVVQDRSTRLSRAAVHHSKLSYVDEGSDQEANWRPKAKPSKSSNNQSPGRMEISSQLRRESAHTLTTVMCIKSHTDAAKASALAELDKLVEEEPYDPRPERGGQGWMRDQAGTPTYIINVPRPQEAGNDDAGAGKAIRATGTQGQNTYTRALEMTEAQRQAQKIAREERARKRNPHLMEDAMQGVIPNATSRKRKAEEELHREPAVLGAGSKRPNNSSRPSRICEVRRNGVPIGGETLRRLEMELQRQDRRNQGRIQTPKTAREESAAKRHANRKGKTHMVEIKVEDLLDQGTGALDEDPKRSPRGPGDAIPVWGSQMNHFPGPQIRQMEEQNQGRVQDWLGNGNQKNMVDDLSVAFGNEDQKNMEDELSVAFGNTTITPSESISRDGRSNIGSDLVPDRPNLSPNGFMLPAGQPTSKSKSFRYQHTNPFKAINTYLHTQTPASSELALTGSSIHPGITTMTALTGLGSHRPSTYKARKMRRNRSKDTWTYRDYRRLVNGISRNDSSSLPINKQYWQFIRILKAKRKTDRVLERAARAKASRKQLVKVETTKQLLARQASATGVFGTEDNDDPLLDWIMSIYDHVEEIVVFFIALSYHQRLSVCIRAPPPLYLDAGFSGVAHEPQTGLLRGLFDLVFRIIGFLFLWQLRERSMAAGRLEGGG
ncbi:MAG: hypothetical protein Q9218_006107 [Villophora microphyllina]